MAAPIFTPAQREAFLADGFIVVPGLADAATRERILARARADLAGEVVQLLSHQVQGQAGAAQPGKLA